MISIHDGGAPLDLVHSFLQLRTQLGVQLIAFAEVAVIRDQNDHLCVRLLYGLQNSKPDP